MYRTTPGGSEGSDRRVRMGKKAASVFPEAVEAAIITSELPPSMSGIARSCASRSSAQPAVQIQRWMRASNIEKLADSELEAGEFIIAESPVVGHGSLLVIERDICTSA